MFAIYLPGRTGYTAQHLVDVGLADLLDDVPPQFTDFLPGPDGQPGLAASWIGRPILVGEFEWTKIRGGAFYFGKSSATDHGPRTTDFARKHRHLGSDVRLADGQEWHIPIARQLPQLLGLDDAGQVVGRPDPRYKTFWDLAWSTLDWFVPDESGECHVSFAAGFDFICAALAINYRVNRDVASWLGLVRSDLFWPVARAVTEFDEMLAAQKKTAPAGLPTSDGGGA